MEPKCTVTVMGSFYKALGHSESHSGPHAQRDDTWRGMGGRPSVHQGGDLGGAQPGDALATASLSPGRRGHRARPQSRRLQCCQGSPRGGHGRLPGQADPKPTTASRVPGEDAGALAAGGRGWQLPTLQPRHPAWRTRAVKAAGRARARGEGDRGEPVHPQAASTPRHGGLGGGGGPGAPAGCRLFHSRKRGNQKKSLHAQEGAWRAHGCRTETGEVQLFHAERL